MADITIQIDGRHYPVVCDDGQGRPRVSIGAHVDQKNKKKSRMLRQVAGRKQ